MTERQPRRVKIIPEKPKTITIFGREIKLKPGKKEVPVIKHIEIDLTVTDEKGRTPYFSS